MSKRVQIAFDLDTNKLKDVYTKATGKTYTSAYKDIENFMISNEYEHRQGSVYHSLENKTRIEVVRDIKLFQKENLQNMFQQYNQKHPPVKHKQKGRER